jgi:hypothetical protein
MEKAVIAKCNDLGGLFYEPATTTAEASELLRLIDGIVFRAYGLSSSERILVEKFMSIDKRPG